MIGVPKRGLFFMRRLQNKPLRKQSHFNHNFDERVYIEAHKRFQKEARGLLPDSQEVKDIRNKIYQELRITKFQQDQRTRQQNSGQTTSLDGAITADFDSFYNLVIVVPEEPDCYEVISICNYYGFPIHVEEDNYASHVRKDMGFTKDDPYPMMTIDSSNPMVPESDMAGKDDILSYLSNHGLIGDFKTRSAWETQGLQYLEQDFGPALADYMRGLKPQLQFYSQLRHFAQVKISKENPAQNVYSFVWKMSKAIRQGFSGKHENPKLIDKSVRMQVAIDTYTERMQGQEFHGGSRPDGADFRAYSLVRPYGHTFMVRNLLEQRSNKNFEYWFNRMDRLCQPRSMF